MKKIAKQKTSKNSSNGYSTYLDVLKKKYAFKNNYEVHIVPPTNLLKADGSSSGYKPSNEIVKPTLTKDVQFNPLQLEYTKEFVGNIYNITPGKRPEMVLRITFYEVQDLELYNSFKKLIDLIPHNYPDDCFFNCQITKYSDYGDRSNALKTLEMSRGYLQNLSDLAFDSSTSNEFMTFYVEFFCDSKYFNIN